jgi:hypothetical protein
MLGAQPAVAVVERPLPHLDGEGTVIEGDVGGWNVEADRVLGVVGAVALVAVQKAPEVGVDAAGRGECRPVAGIVVAARGSAVRAAEAAGAGVGAQGAAVVEVGVEVKQAQGPSDGVAGLGVATEPVAARLLTPGDGGAGGAQEGGQRGRHQGAAVADRGLHVGHAFGAVGAERGGGDESEEREKRQENPAFVAHFGIKKGEADPAVGVRY